jgi:hypothetical protein
MIVLGAVGVKVGAEGDEDEGERLEGWRIGRLEGWRVGGDIFILMRLPSYFGGSAIILYTGNAGGGEQIVYKGAAFGFVVAEGEEFFKLVYDEEEATPSPALPRCGGG